jgi:hypothetical protein
MTTLSIRYGVFETNSSSSHSLTIVSNNKKNTIASIMETIACIRASHLRLSGKVDVSVDMIGFGWEFEKYNGFHTKTAYLLTGIFLSNQNSWEYAKENSHELQMLMKVIREEVGLDLELPDKSLVSYIDHQSSDVYKEAFESESVLKMFLFNPESYLETGNDNE